MNKSAKDFRTEVRQWLEQNCPDSQRQPMVMEERVWAAAEIDFPTEDSRLWLERMIDKGWITPDWPEQYGGAGLSAEEVEILEQELTRLGCRQPQYSFGNTMIGPILLEFGNEEQKAEFLPLISRAALRWCQGYSEPGAGSDLASLRTSATDCGDHYLVNGSKIWTSHADEADWIYCLVRTDSEVPRQRGISFLLFNMRQPGVTTKPIRLISGESEFCEVFFDNVRAEKRHRIGEENAGWTVAKRLLEHERRMMSNLSVESKTAVTPTTIAARTVAEGKGRIDDPQLRRRYVSTLIDRKALHLTSQRVEAEVATRSGGQAGMVLKLFGTELDQREQQLMIDMAGFEAMHWDSEDAEEHNLGITRNWLFAFSNTIAGGSSEVQMNIIAKRILNLPD